MSWARQEQNLRATTLRYYSSLAISNLGQGKDKNCEQQQPGKYQGLNPSGVKPLEKGGLFMTYDNTYRLPAFCSRTLSSDIMMIGSDFKA